MSKMKLHNWYEQYEKASRRRGSEGSIEGHKLHEVRHLQNCAIYYLNDDRRN